MTADQPHHSHFYAMRRLGRLIRKEVSTILRDRRTIITLVLMPLLLYPLLTIAFQQFLIASPKAEEKTTYVIGVAEDPPVVLRKKLSIDATVLLHSHPLARAVCCGSFLTIPKGEEERFFEQLDRGILLLEKRPGPESVPSDELVEGQKRRPDIRVRPTSNLVDEVRSGRVHVGVRIPGVFSGRWRRGINEALYCDLIYLETSPISLEAKEYIERCLAAANDHFLFALLEAPTRQPVVLMSPRYAPLKDPDAKPGLPVSTLLPLILILMTITGAVYPAIDLTAGERERGTLEVLVAAPVPRLGLLFAKYVSVVIVAVLTATVNVVCMTVTLSVTPLGKQIFSQSGLTGLAIVEIFGLLLLFAAFFSAVLLAVTSFARSFKEAQAYLIPLMLVSLTPGIMALLPGLNLDGALSVIPLLNIVLLTRNLFDPVLYGAVPLWTAAIVVLSTVVYALAAVGIAARVFGAEAVLYNEQSGWGDLFRRPTKSQPAASVSGALLCLALLFPLAFVINGSLAGVKMSVLFKILLQAVFTVILFGVIPFFAAWMGHVRFREGFRTQRSGVRTWLPAVLLGLSMWPLVAALEMAMRGLYSSAFRERIAEEAQTIAKLLRAESPFVIVLSMGIIIPVLEEIFFRGYLLSALLRRTRPAFAIITSGLLFGVFHVAGQQFILAERAVATILLGMLLGWICWRTGSVFPGMVLHIVHNSTLLLLSYYDSQLVSAGILPASDDLPATWLIAGAGATAVSACLFWLLSKPIRSDLSGRDGHGTDNVQPASSPSVPEDDSHGNRQGNDPSA